MPTLYIDSGSFNDLQVTGSTILSGSVNVSGSLLVNSVPVLSSTNFNNFTSSYNTGSFTGSFTGQLIGTASWARNALTASYISGSISSTPGGSDTQIQFNSASTFSGSQYFTYNYQSQSLQQGSSTQAIGQYSHAEGSQSKTGIQTSYSASITTGIITLSADYGDQSSVFPSDSRLYIYDSPFDDFYGRESHIVSQSYYTAPNTIIELANSNSTTSKAYVLSLYDNLNNNSGDQIIPGDYSHAEGSYTITIGNYSRAEGGTTQAIGNYSHAEGNDTQAIGDVSHAEGSTTRAIGSYSHAEGGSTQTIGSYSHAEGDGTQAIGNYSHAEGWNTITSGAYQHVQGQWNISSSAQSAFIIGNGIDGSNRSNLVFASGSEFQITGSLQVSGSITGSLFGSSSWAYASITASYASTASYLNTLNQDLTFNGNLILNGTASITYLNVFYESSSIIYSSGSNQFGDATNDTQTLIGRTIVSGSFEVTGSTISTLGFTGSLKGTADSASYVTTAQTASYVLQAVSSSYALTASYVAGNGPFPYTGSATISGSLSVVGPITSDRGLSEANYIALDKWDLLINGAPTLITVAVTSGSATGITTLLTPFIIVKNTKITSMSFEVTSGTTTTTASLGIYNSDPISYNPQNLIASCSNIIVSATGTRSGSLNQTLTLTPGLYYTAFQHSGSNTITCRSVPNTNTYNVLGLTTPGNTTVPNYIAGVRPTAGIAGNLPPSSSAFSTINRLGAASLPAIWIRVVS